MEGPLREFLELPHPPGLLQKPSPQSWKTVCLVGRIPSVGPGLPVQDPWWKGSTCRRGRSLHGVPGRKQFLSVLRGSRHRTVGVRRGGEFFLSVCVYKTERHEEGTAHTHGTGAGCGAGRGQRREEEAGAAVTPALLGYKIRLRPLDFIL